LLNNIQKMEELYYKHVRYRNKCLNLIASENYVSPFVRSYLSSEFGNRYGCYENLKPEKREYTGNEYIHKFEMETIELVKGVFNADYVDLRPIGGHMAGVATVLGLTEPGDLVLEIAMKDWGHGLVKPMRKIKHLAETINIDWIPYDKDKRLEVLNLKNMIDKLNPKLIIFGGSGTLFPEPIYEIKKYIEDKDRYIAYDVSHVTGLIAGKTFPNPLDQGADIMFGSTHKSFPGPQGGMILSRRRDVFKRVVDALSPGLVTSHHLNRLPALTASLLEMKQYGEEYSKQIINNSRILGKALLERGFNVMASDYNFTDTHILLVDISELGSSYEISRKLEQANILVSDDFGENIGEIRIGTAEVTRKGMKEKEMIKIADLFKRCLINGENKENIKDEIAIFKEAFQGCSYCLT
jgi:glycine hydroxymethyltransferase